MRLNFLVSFFGIDVFFVSFHWAGYTCLSSKLLTISNIHSSTIFPNILNVFGGIALDPVAVLFLEVKLCLSSIMLKGRVQYYKLRFKSVDYSKVPQFAR